MLLTALVFLLHTAPNAAAQFLDGRSMTLRFFNATGEFLSLTTNFTVNSTSGVVELPVWGPSYTVDVFDVDDSHASIRIGRTATATNTTDFGPTNSFHFTRLGGFGLPFTNATIGSNNFSPSVPDSRLSITADTVSLRVNGLVFTPTNFVTIDITTIPRDVPVMTIDVSEVRLCWRSQSNRLYQVQYRSELTANAWVDLGLPVPGNGTTNCVADAVAGPKRFYQVVGLP